MLTAQLLIRLTWIKPVLVGLSRYRYQWAIAITAFFSTNFCVWNDSKGNHFGIRSFLAVVGPLTPPPRSPAPSPPPVCPLDIRAARGQHGVIAIR